ncbi:UNKNOWN [Stylonychia lemnae]|uniref:C2 domain-containing protein n=1 Tax=Stylonychia lemnae TaxID=5949 RepID=A0A078AFG2_STYLE|nr:UNKNOWN [Stylonychia lemnae]|eukprot:CDW80920.1 UNKNOWN [Stylonychia lemnae]
MKDLKLKLHICTPDYIFKTKIYELSKLSILNEEILVRSDINKKQKTCIDNENDSIIEIQYLVNAIELVPLEEFKKKQSMLRIFVKEGSLWRDQVMFSKIDAQLCIECDGKIIMKSETQLKSGKKPDFSDENFHIIVNDFDKKLKLQIVDTELGDEGKIGEAIIKITDIYTNNLYNIRFVDLYHNEDKIGKIKMLFQFITIETSCPIPCNQNSLEKQAIIGVHCMNITQFDNMNNLCLKIKNSQFQKVIQTKHQRQGYFPINQSMVLNNLIFQEQDNIDFLLINHFGSDEQLIGHTGFNLKMFQDKNYFYLPVYQNDQEIGLILLSFLVIKNENCQISQSVIIDDNKLNGDQLGDIQGEQKIEQNNKTYLIQDDKQAIDNQLEQEQQVKSQKTSNEIKEYLDNKTAITKKLLDSNNDTRQSDYKHNNSNQLIIDNQQATIQQRSQFKKTSLIQSNKIDAKNNIQKQIAMANKESNDKISNLETTQNPQMRISRESVNKRALNS